MNVALKLLTRQYGAKEHYNVLAHTAEKTKEIVHSTPVDQSVFPLNIDKIKYKELKQILENTDREEEFGFSDSSELEEKSSGFKEK